MLGRLVVTFLLAGKVKDSQRQIFSHCNLSESLLARMVSGVSGMLPTRRWSMIAWLVANVSTLTNIEADHQLDYGAH
jgi:hypothetical protein